MQSYTGGNDHAFALLFGRYKDRLYRYLKRQCRNDGIAEELCQDVWERLIKHHRKFDMTRSFATYLFSIAHNRMIDYLRGVSFRSVEEFQEGSQPGNSSAVESQAFSREQVRRFEQVLGALPGPQKEIFILHEETSLTIAEMAEVTGVKPETAKSRLRFALVNLRKGMEGYL